MFDKYLIAIPFLSVLLNSIAQIVLKFASDAGTIKGTIAYSLVGFGIFAISAIIWIFALRSMPLNSIYPLMSISFLLVPIFSYFIFGEHITVKYVVGSFLIMGGVSVISMDSFSR